MLGGALVPLLRAFTLCSAMRCNTFCAHQGLACTGYSEDLSKLIHIVLTCSILTCHAAIADTFCSAIIMPYQAELLESEREHALNCSTPSTISLGSARSTACTHSHNV